MSFRCSKKQRKNMLKIEKIPVAGYEQVFYGENPTAGLRAFIAVHNTRLGPACGGIRLMPYNGRQEALEDVLRLAKAMTYKSALAGIGFGGGKSVVIADPLGKNSQIFQALGEFVETLHGKYIAAKDMNVRSTDLMEVRKHTKHVLGIETVEGSSGDPSPITAHGVFKGMVSTAEQCFGTTSLKGVKVAIQGAGHVGFFLSKLLCEAEANVMVSDINPTAVQRIESELGAEPVSSDRIANVECDIFSPCAMGGILNAQSVERLSCKAIVGAANNQLASPAAGTRLHERGVIYAPDYVVNSGGIINIFYELVGYNPKLALEKTEKIYDTLKEIFARSKQTGIPPFSIADQLAEDRFSERRN